MTTPTLDPEIAAFLEDGGYASIDDWMADSDFVRGSDGEWVYPSDYADDAVADMPVDPIGTIEGAMEASGWGA